MHKVRHRCVVVSSETTFVYVSGDCEGQMKLNIYYIVSMCVSHWTIVQSSVVWAFSRGSRDSINDDKLYTCTWSFNIRREIPERQVALSEMLRCRVTHTNAADKYDWWSVEWRGFSLASCQIKRLPPHTTFTDTNIYLDPSTRPVYDNL